MPTKSFFNRTFTRRDALRLGLYGLGVSVGLPAFFHNTATALAATDQNSAKINERILVVVELSGGNDGLNTIVPYGDDAYYRQRPTIGIPADKVRKINDHFGFHPSMAGFERLYKDGKLAIVHGCGYEKPSLSHFESMGFWHTGAPNAGEPLGWLGRVADAMDPAGQRNYIVNIATTQSLAVRSGKHSPLVFYDPERFFRSGVYQQQPIFQRFGRARDTSNASLNFLTAIAANAADSAAFVRQAWADYKTPVDYGAAAAGLGLDLRKVAALIKAGMPTRLYYVSYAGNPFDTHVYQSDVHARLLIYTADALRAFIDDVKRIGRGADVAVMVFTEFGRRVPENTSKGTDHGAATPMFVIGEKVKGGLYSAPVSLTNLDDGNLIYTTDFRRVYASMITEWLGYEDAASLLRGHFQPLGLFA
ncbi:MAG TPA: DUF1501 domain-containing protein [Methylomirabilota bacterium]|jgi:uncharacterized protein (DUF1501 family)|nr:DUF1501 domain-containing protein [Methylomirabilota bacterium]